MQLHLCCSFLSSFSHILKVKRKYLLKKYFMQDISKLHLLHEYAAFRHRGSLLSLFSLSIMSFISLKFLDIFIVLRDTSWRCLCLMHKWKIKAINDINVCDNFRRTAKMWRIISIFRLYWIFLQIFLWKNKTKELGQISRQSMENILHFPFVDTRGRCCPTGGVCFPAVTDSVSSQCCVSWHEQPMIKPLKTEHLSHYKSL